jgi:hypothetical protein
VDARAGGLANDQDARVLMGAQHGARLEGQLALARSTGAHFGQQHCE